MYYFFILYSYLLFFTSFFSYLYLCIFSLVKPVGKSLFWGIGIQEVRGEDTDELATLRPDNHVCLLLAYEEELMRLKADRCDDC